MNNDEFVSSQETSDVIGDASDTIEDVSDVIVDASDTIEDVSDVIADASYVEDSASGIIERISERLDEDDEAAEGVSETMQGARETTGKTTGETLGQAESSESATKSIINNIKAKSIWLRLFFMLATALLYSVSRLVVGAIIVLQFFFVLFTGKTNKKLLSSGQALSTYTYQIICYLTFNTEERPFPFDSDWPKAE